MNSIAVLFVCVGTILYQWPASLTNVAAVTYNDESSAFIHMLVVIDTEGVHELFANETPSKDPNHPSPIDHSYAFMVVPKQYAVEKSGTADLHLKAQEGDVLRISTVSESNGYEHQAIVYYISETEFWTEPQLEFNYERDIAIPTDRKFTGFTLSRHSFTYLSTTFKKLGTVFYYVRFALYYRSRKGLKLFGFFEWDPIITIE